MKAPICHKYNGVNFLLQHRRCAPQHLPCTPVLPIQAGHVHARSTLAGVLEVRLRRGLSSTWREGPALRHREAGKETGQLLPHGLKRGCKLDGACQCKLLLGLKVQPEAELTLENPLSGTLSPELEIPLSGTLSPKLLISMTECANILHTTLVLHCGLEGNCRELLSTLKMQPAEEPVAGVRRTTTRGRLT